MVSPYRSAFYWTTPAQRDAAAASRDTSQKALAAEGYGTITTEISEGGPFYFAETITSISRQQFP